jgi:hypothetical protein
MKNTIIKILNLCLFKLKQFINYLSVEKGLKILSVEYHNKGRFLIYTLANNKLSSSEDILESLFTTLQNHKRFQSFGDKKVIITTALIEGNDCAYHHNVLIDNYTTFEEYYNQVKDIITQNFEEPIYIIPLFKVRVWNVDKYANKNITITKSGINISKKGFHTQARNENNFIKPLK